MLSSPGPDAPTERLHPCGRRQRLCASHRDVRGRMRPPPHFRTRAGEQQPDPVTYALIAEQFGIDGIVVHLREDRRHVNERDVRLLREMITTKLDLEMAAVDEIIDIATDGGTEGFEIPKKIFDSVVDNLAENGKFIFVTSTLSNYQKLIDYAVNLTFD